jgi:NAD(P)-dependent dehydrogenase (short-subunit alcohol dehydrogenase family)
MGKIVIINVSQGIGFDLAKQYLHQGAEVIGTCRNPASARGLMKLSRDFPGLALLALDVTEPVSVRDFGECIQPHSVDVLINNAGDFDSNLCLGALEYGEWRSVLESSTIGFLATIDVCLSALRRAPKYSKVIDISGPSGSTHNTSAGGYFYRSRQAAFNRLIRSLADDYRAAGIIFAVISPRLIETTLIHRLKRPRISPEASAHGLVRVISALTLEQSGKFLGYSGSGSPW